MCGRYELHTHPAAIALAFGLLEAPALTPRYNVAPMQQVPVIRQRADATRECVDMRWGLVPRWAKDPSIGAKMINARAETIAEKPSFRTSFRHHRCLIPADGFYEWRVTAHGKQPMHVARRDGAPFGFAGLFERWLAADGAVLDTCTILTTTANELLRPIHARMPVIVAPEHYARWLDAANPEVTDLFVPFPSDALAWHPVSTRVNAVRNDDATLIVPVAPAAVAAATNDAATPEDGEAPPAEPVQAKLL
ncbi:MAG: SOS response-associated peptidase [Casimicrobiaceae bacterium]